MTWSVRLERLHLFAAECIEASIAVLPPKCRSQDLAAEQQLSLARLSLVREDFVRAMEALRFVFLWHRDKPLLDHKGFRSRASIEAQSVARAAVEWCAECGKRGELKEKPLICGRM